MTRTEEIINILSEFIIPKCELNFNNNYELLVAVLLSAQTTDKAVNKVCEKLFLKYKTIFDLATAKEEDIYIIIKTLGLANTKSKNLKKLANVIVDKYNGQIPSKLEDLEALPGVGRKTANVVRALGFNIPSIPVDTHVMRVAIRLKIASPQSTVLDVEKALMRKLPKYMWIDSHHYLLLFGRYYCKSQNPKCDGCRLKKYCKLN